MIARRRCSTAAVAVLVLIAGCSASDESDADPDTPPVASIDASATSDAALSSDSVAVDTTVSDEPTDTPPAETTPVVETTTTTTEPPVVEEIIIPSAQPITLLTPADGQGSRPKLQWEPVDGTTYYTVTVYAPDGRPYWASVLVETETFVGGPVQIDEDKPGPRIIDGMSWLVVAYGEDQVPIAVSGERPISP